MPDPPADFRILWTALPRGVDDGHLVVDVFVSHRLGVGAAPGDAFTLAQFPDVMDWPDVVANRLTFGVEVGDNTPAVAANRVPWTENGTPADLHLSPWPRLLPPTTRVAPWTRRNPARRPIYSFPAIAVADYVHDQYQKAGQGSMPDPALDDDLDDLADDLGDLLDTRPDVERQEPTSQVTGGDTTGGGPAPTQQPLGCLAAPFAWLVWLLRRLVQMLLGGPPPGPKPSTQGQPPPPVHTKPKQVTYTFPPPGPASAHPALAAIDEHVATAGVSPPAGWTPPGTSIGHGAAAVAGAWRFYRRPESEPERTTGLDPSLVPPPPTVPDWDFHQRMGALGDYPGLLHRLGVVLRLRVPTPGTAPTSVRVVPLWDGQAMPNRDLTPRTHCVLDATGFRAEIAAGSELRDGFLDLSGSSDSQASLAGIRMMCVDVDGAALKLVHTAASLMRRRYLRGRGLVRNEPRAEGLAALRTAGIAIMKDGTAADLKQRLAQVDLLSASSGNDVPDDLWADDVVRGFRVEVRDVTGPTPGEWRSLCQRTGDYHVLADDGTVVESLHITDDGYVKRTSSTSADARNSPLYIHETLVRWDGWSLVAPRPGRRIRLEVTDGASGATGSEEKSEPPRPEAPPQLHLAVSFRPVDGTLQRLRFGRDYRFRLPAVDLAGESAVASATTPVSEAITYRRFEPLAPPALLPAGVFTAGESQERLVIRSRADMTPDDYVATVLAPISLAYRADAVRHVFPAKVTHEQAEQHGCLDDAIGSTAPARLARGWAVSLRADNALSIQSLPGLDDPNITSPFGVPAAGTIAGSDEKYAVNSSSGTLPTPYLPDPLVAAVGLRGLPAANFVAAGGPLRAVNLPATGDVVCQVPLEQSAWPEVPSFRIRVVERPWTADPVVDGSVSFTNAHDPPHWDPAARVLTVYLAKGQTAQVPYSSVPDDRLACLGPVQWLDAEPDSDLERYIVAGCHWMVSPARTLTLVHAVQKPLVSPELSSATTSRTAGATLATITGRMSLHPDTTGEVTLLATWEDVVDDGTAPALLAEKHEVVLDTFTIPLPLADGTAANTAFPPRMPASDPLAALTARHDFADTRHRMVSYRLDGSTRFREYFPPELQSVVDADGADGFSIRGAALAVPVPNSEPPAAPSVRYSMPSFGWDTGDPQPTTAWTSFERSRQGGGVRVFLDRPWHTSGPGERLGVVIARTGAPTHSHSILGADPTWHSAYHPDLPALDAAMFTGGTLYPDVVLATGQHVDVVGYEPTLDVERNQWFVDVTLDLASITSAYWPFLRLSLTRFQPQSIPGAMASEVMQAEPVPIAPGRRIHAAVSGNDVHVRVDGLKPDWSGENLMLLALEEADVADPDELAWRPVGSTPGGPDVGDQLEARLDDAVKPQPNPTELRWERTLTMPGTRGDRPLRLVVRELELRAADPEVVRERFAGLDPLGTVAQELLRRGQVPRVVYADAVRLA